VAGKGQGGSCVECAPGVWAGEVWCGSLELDVCVADFWGLVVIGQGSRLRGSLLWKYCWRSIMVVLVSAGF
jgi:hypothetical protein